jgi:hypothetical protein
MDARTDIEIVDRPWLLAGMLAVFAATSVATLVMALAERHGLGILSAAILLAACLWAALRAVRFGRLTLRPDGTARYTLRDLRGTWHHDFAAGSLRAAVQSHRDGDGVTGRVMLLIDGAGGVTRIPFTGYFATPPQRRTPWRGSWPGADAATGA